MLRQTICALALILLPVSLLRAQPMADHVPSDALVYIGWSGSSGAGDAYANSRLKAVVESSDAQKIFTETLPALARRAGAKNPQAGEALSVISAIGAPLWRHPTAFYWEGLDFTNPRQPIPSMALICNAGDDAQRLANNLQSAIDHAGRSPVPMKVTTDAGMVSLLVGPAKAPAAGANLSTDQQFKDTLSKVQPNSVAAVYVNVQGIVKLIDHAPAASPAEQRDKQQWQHVKEALGLNSVTAAAWSGAFDGRDWSSQAFIAAPAPRSGIFSLLDATPMSDDLLKLIPQSATMVAAKSFDASRLVSDIRATAAKVDPQAPQSIDQALQQFHSMTGLDLQKDLLDTLGDQWAAFSSPSVAGSTSLGMCLLNKLKDPARADANITRFVQSLGRLASGALHRQQMQLAVRQISEGQLTIHYLATPMLRPAWAVKDGVLYVGMYPQVVSAAAASTDSAAAGKSILQSDAFVAFRKRLGDKPVTGIQYFDLPRTVPLMYPQWLVFSGYAGFADLFGAPTPAMMVPPLNDILAQLTPAASAAWVDDAGWHLHNVSPFPGAQVLGTDTASTVGASALLTSILLPSLNRARETANRVKCASNERQIGQAILLYSNDNRGKYPPDLGTLIKTQDLTIDCFVCPSSNNSIPLQVLSGSKDVQAQWINQHSSYTYIGKGLNNNAPADQVVLYEKPEDHDQDGMNLLYGDGHVAWEQMPRAQEEVHKPQPGANGNRPVPGL